MKTIKIKKYVKDQLEVFADGESLNKAMRRLLESSDVVGCVELDESPVNVNIDDDVWEMLKRCKVVTSESHSDTISRLLTEVDES